MKKCRICNKNKPLTQFGKYKDKRSGKEYRRHVCHECSRAYEYERYRRPGVAEKAKIAAKKHHLRTTYGITLEEYQGMQQKQDGKCGICGTTLNEPNIDHCHETGKVRGLLCWPCNVAIGHLKHDVTILRSAINYLEEHHGPK